MCCFFKYLAKQFFLFFYIAIEKIPHMMVFLFCAPNSSESTEAVQAMSWSSTQHIDRVKRLTITLLGNLEHILEKY